jgi:pimeloyl-ACP methyl ester carboxylesterase
MKKLGKALLVITVLLMATIGYWRYDSPNRMHRASPQALAALASDSKVTVTQDELIVFRPTNTEPHTGLIFYPGGECDERGYTEPLRAIAEAGYLVVLVSMPLQLAVFAPGKADEVVAAFPEIDTWAIAGHSLGGSMAAHYAYKHPDTIDGLLLWDAYAPDDMSASTIAIRMIHRSDDSGSTPADYESKLVLLPEQTEFVPLKGAQHLQFGRFIAGRLYRGEPPAELDQDEQLTMVIKYSAEFLDNISN